MSQEKGGKMKINRAFFGDVCHSKEGPKWFAKKNETDAGKLVQMLMEDCKLNWAHRMLMCLLDSKQKTQYVFFAEKKLAEEDAAKSRKAAYYAKNYAVTPK